MHSCKNSTYICDDKTVSLKQIAYDMQCFVRNLMLSFENLTKCTKNIVLKILNEYFEHFKRYENLYEKDFICKCANDVIFS